MRPLLARLVLVISSIPVLGSEVEAQALVLDSCTTETKGVEQRLMRQLKDCLTPYLNERMPGEKDLVVNVLVDPDGTVRVLNTHGGTRDMRNAVNKGLDRAVV